MKPSQWPDWLEDIWAKSTVDSTQSGESLAYHTWLVLKRLADLAHLRPHLATYLDAPNLWHCLFWACFLHDFGKAARGFQDMVRGGERWQRRHEVLSLAFLDWIMPAFSLTEQQWILAAIVSHHRDEKEITSAYDKNANPKLVEEMLSHLDENTVRGLWRWVHSCTQSWIGELDLYRFGVQSISIVDESLAIQMICQEGIQHTHAWLAKYRRFVDGLKFERNTKVVTALVMLRGLTTNADHAASAHLAQVPQGMQRSWVSFTEELSIKTHIHQQVSATQHHTSAMLIAPTGSGKTEAALFWVMGDGTEPTPRVFYALPYQASMNAMYDRLCSPRYFGDQTVGLQHGRALQALYQRLLDGETGPSSAVSAAKWKQNLTRLHACQIKIFSPYQMLKAAYQIKGYEGMLADYTQAAFIFDEVHAYDPERLALILAFVKYLREHYGSRFFIMSATFPSILYKIIADVLDIHEPVRADPELFEKFKRHHLQLLDGDLLDQGVAHVVADVQQGKSVLVCCNTVQRAQDMRQMLLRHLLPDQVELIHSRFTMKDRLGRETAIRNRCEIDVDHNAVAVVATQVVEVSLNIDLDTIYSDPAPLDALVQRFGRINRARKKGIVPVHVFRQPRDGQYVYPEPLIRKTLDVLERHNNRDIDEIAIGKWLDEIYDTPEILEPWMKRYTEQYQLAASILRGLRPFNSDEQREKQFEELFDGVEVLPHCFEKQYIEHMTNDEFLEASRFFVSISERKYRQLARQGKIRPMEDSTRKKWVVLQDYDSELGLLFDTPSNELNGEI